MNKTPLQPKTTFYSAITELSLTGELLSISTKYPNDKGILDLNFATGIGMSGMWVIAQGRSFDYVVLRVRESDTMYKIYIGRFLRLDSTPDNRKKIVVFDKLEMVGYSDTIPLIFNGGKSSGQGKTYLSVTPAVKCESEESPAPEVPSIYRAGTAILTTARPDQSPFANAVRENCKNSCVITGVTMQWRTEAAHLIPHRDRGIPDVTNGLLMRRDIHALFDQGHCAINPDNMKMYFSKESRHQDEDLKNFHLTLISTDKLEKQVNKEFLVQRWNDFLQQHGLA